jgi:hypothetical protein
MAKVKARLQYNRLTKTYLSWTRPPRNPSINWLELKITKWHYHALFVSTLIGLCSFYVQIQNSQIRATTFTRNFALIDSKYGQIHKEAIGQDTKLNKYGYPDIGNNIYSDLLPYKDWVKVNNA